MTDDKSLRLSYTAQRFDHSSSPYPDGFQCWSADESRPRDTSWGYVLDQTGRKLHVCQGAWIVRHADGQVQVLSHDDYQALRGYGEAETSGTVPAAPSTPVVLLEFREIISFTRSLFHLEAFEICAELQLAEAMVAAVLEGRAKLRFNGRDGTLMRFEAPTTCELERRVKLVVFFSAPAGPTGHADAGHN